MSNEQSDTPSRRMGDSGGGRPKLFEMNKQGGGPLGSTPTGLEDRFSQLSYGTKINHIVN
jgi:hypothetical protein